MMKTLQTLALTLTVVLFGASARAGDKKQDAPPANTTALCTATIKAAALKAVPNGTIDRCKGEKDHGIDLVEVKMTRKDGSRVELDVGLDGKILQTEEKIAMDKVPATVMKGFATKYPKTKAEGAEKQAAEKSTTYEIAFTINGARKEATFTEDGKFVEEE